MRKIGTKAMALAALCVVATPMSAAMANTLGPHAARCNSGGRSVIARVTGLKVRAGILRVQLYGSNKDQFLERGGWIQRVEVVVPRNGAVDVCVPVDRPGSYVIAVRHDANSDGEADRGDGGGFSGNQRMSMLDYMLKRKPNFNQALFSVGNGPRIVPVTMQYL